MKKWLIILLVVGFAAPAMADKWDWWDASRLSQSYTLTDKNAVSHVFNVAGSHLTITRLDGLKLKLGDFEMSVGDSQDTAAKNENLNDRDRAEDDHHISPHVEAAYSFKSDVIHIKSGIGFQTPSDQNAAAALSTRVNSVVAALATRVKLGSGYVAAGGWYAINPGDYTVIPIADISDVANGISKAKVIDGSVEDAKVYSIYLTGGFPINDKMALGGGVSYLNGKQNTGETSTSDKNLVSWYLQVPLTVAQGVRIIPEVGGSLKADLKTTSTASDKDDTDTYIYTKFQIAF